MSSVLLLFSFSSLDDIQVFILWRQLTRDCGGGELSGWFSAEIEPCVIGVAVEAVETVMADNLTKGEHVDGKRGGVQAQSLGAYLCRWLAVPGGTGVSDGDNRGSCLREPGAVLARLRKLD